MWIWNAMAESDIAHIEPPEHWPGLLPSLRLARENLLALWPCEVYERPVVRKDTLFAKALIVHDPAFIKHVYVNAAENYPISLAQRQLFNTLFGRHNMISQEGAEWEIPRRALESTFARSMVDTREEAILGCVRAFTDRITVLAPDVEIDVLANRFAWSTSFLSILSISDAGVIDGIAAHMASLRNAFGKIGLTTFLSFPDWATAGPQRRAGSGFRQLYGVISEELDRRTAAGETGDDVLGRMMASIGRSDLPAKRASILQNTVAAFATGHDTSAMAISWALYLLAKRPAKQAELRAALDPAISKGGLSFAAVRGVPYLEQVVKETLRLYPPLPFLARKAATPDQFGEWKIARNTTVITILYALHRHAKLWESPDAFLPERFATPGNVRPWAYLPFGLGRRVCPGRALADIQTMCALAAILSRFEVGLAPDAPPVEVETRISLRPRHPMRLRFRPL